MKGMDSDEAEFAVGKKTINIVKTIPIGETLFGNIYIPSNKNEASEIYTTLITNHIPTILMNCSNGCGHCKKFEKNVLYNTDFINWMKSEKKCSILYLKRADKITPIDDYSFTYTNHFGKVIDAKICGKIIFKTFQDNNSKIISNTNKL
jgi:hypothetical protein